MAPKLDSNTGKSSITKRLPRSTRELEYLCAMRKTHTISLLAFSTSKKASTSLMRAKSQKGLFKLPPELRNRIYEMVIWETGKVDIRDGRIKPEPTLTQTCRQIRTESLPIFEYQAPMLARTIAFRVNDFDFFEVMIFVHGLSKEQVRAVETKDNLVIYLSLSKRWKDNYAALDRWLAFCGLVLERPLAKNPYHFAKGRSELQFFGLCPTNRVNEGVREEAEKICQAWEAHRKRLKRQDDKRRGDRESSLLDVSGALRGEECCSSVGGNMFSVYPAKR